MLSWISISILWNTEAVTPWAILLIFFWPIADTILAIVRRFSKGKAIFQPDPFALSSTHDARRQNCAFRAEPAYGCKSTCHSLDVTPHR